MAEVINTRTTVGNHETLRAVVASTLSELIDDQIYDLRAYAFYGDDGLESITLPNIRQAGNYAFASCSRLATVNLGYLHRLSAYLFQNCTRLDTVYAAETETSDTAPFSGCTNLQTIYMPELLSLASNMFLNCTKLTDVYVPKLKSGNNYAFQGCSSLEEIDLRNLTSVSYNMFSGCSKLRTVLLSSNCSSIGQYGFYGCTSLTSISFPSVKSIGDHAFFGCTALRHLSVPSATSASSYAFYDVPFESLSLPSVTSLGNYVVGGNGAEEIDFSAKVSISSNSLASDRNLTSLILRNAAQCTMGNTNALSNTPIWSGYGWIYVPDDLVDTYKAATNWSAYTDRIVSLEEYPKAVTGTITDSWSDIFAAEQDGTYRSRYQVGDTMLLDIGDVTYAVRIIGIDQDDRADGLGKAPITWMTVGLYQTTTYVNNVSGNYVMYSWSGSNLRNYMRNTVFPLIDQNVRSHIIEVTKNQRVYSASSGVSYETTTDTIFVPSALEVGVQDTGETGQVYSGTFSDDESRRMHLYHYGTGDNTTWWLRSAGTSSQTFCTVWGAHNVTVDGVTTTDQGGGVYTGYSSSNSFYFPICFCT